MLPALPPVQQVGTPMYAAPEVFSRQPLGLPCDIWSLGCILYELAALKHAFDGRSMRELRFKVRSTLSFGSPPPSLAIISAQAAWRKSG